VLAEQKFLSVKMIGLAISGLTNVKVSGITDWQLAAYLKLAG
jgi:hypothetical protein